MTATLAPYSEENKMKDKEDKKEEAKEKVEEIANECKYWNNAPGKDKAPQPQPYNPGK